jgi:hypothetical protein
MCLGNSACPKSFPRFDAARSVSVSFSTMNVAVGNDVNPARASAKVVKVDFKISVDMII